MALFRAFVTNLGAYNAGALIGKWVDFPTYNTDGEWDDLLHSIGVVHDLTDEDELKEIPGNLRGVACEEYFITDYDDDYGICKGFGEYERLDDLEDIAEELDVMDESEQRAIIAIMNDEGCDVRSAKDIYDDGFVLSCDPDSGSSIGYEYAEETGLLSGIPDNIANYFDYESYGHDLKLGSRTVAFDGGLFFYD